MLLIICRPVVSMLKHTNWYVGIRVPRQGLSQCSLSHVSGTVYMWDTGELVPCAKECRNTLSNNAWLNLYVSYDTVPWDLFIALSKLKMLYLYLQFPCLQPIDFEFLKLFSPGYVKLQLSECKSEMNRKHDRSYLQRISILQCILRKCINNVLKRGLFFHAGKLK